MKNIKPYLQEHQERFLNELIELLKIPSISADSAYKNEVLKTDEAVKVSLEKAGCDHVEICKTEGYPIVYGEKTAIGGLELNTLKKENGAKFEFPFSSTVLAKQIGLGTTAPNK